MLIISEFDPRAEYPKLELIRFDSPSIFASWVREVALSGERRVDLPNALRLFYFVDGPEYSRARYAKIGMDVDIEFLKTTVGGTQRFGYRIGLSQPLFFSTILEMTEYLWNEYVI